jgi:hypothetical protein
VPARLARDPDLNLAHYGRELADLFLIATRQPTPTHAPAHPDHHEE